ncbi:10334_t:CDS:1, partial [Scutellospora calospora]
YRRRVNAFNQSIEKEQTKLENIKRDKTPELDDIKRDKTPKLDDIKRDQAFEKADNERLD